MTNTFISTSQVSRFVAAGLLFAGTFLVGGDAVPSAQSGLTVRTVPWLGLPSKEHEVFSGGTLILQGMATQGLTDTPATGLQSATWDPGNGDAVVTLPAPLNPLALELSKAYTGFDGQVFVATLTVTPTTGPAVSDTFRIVVRTRTIDVEANMAIDRGLWHIHKSLTRQMNTSVTPNVPVASLASDIPATAGAVQAYAINNHRTSGDVAEDPYVHDVTRMLRFIESQLTPVPINPQTHAIVPAPPPPASPNVSDNPDSNGNGHAVAYNTNPQNYVQGQIVDALVANDDKSLVTVLGPLGSPVQNGVRGRTYEEIVKDINDYSAWSQIDTQAHGARGSWHYTPSSNTSVGHGDNSIAQWPAIGGIAAEREWGINIQPFVKSEMMLHVPKTQVTNTSFVFGGTGGNVSAVGSFGYGDVARGPWPNGQSEGWSQNFATSPSGLIQYIWAGVQSDSTPDDARETEFQNGLKFMARFHRIRNNYQCCDTFWGGLNIYALYATAKAYRLALDDTGKPKPITLVDDDPADSTPPWNWYSNDPPSVPAPASLAGPRGVARALLNMQQPNGSWNVSGTWNANMTTSWAIIILSPQLFSLGPNAACTANPSQIGSFGGVVNFSGAASTHNDDDGVIASYSWDFGDGTSGSGPTVSHSYPGRTTFPHTYNAVLTVTDQDGLSDTVSCPVTQVNTNVAPNAIASATGAPYNFCPGTPLILDGSASTDPEDGSVTSYAWDLTLPITFTDPAATTATFDATAVFAGRPLGEYDIGLRVTDSLGVADADFTKVIVRTATDPLCNQPPVANPDTFSVAEDGVLMANVIENDDDEDGDTLSATLVTSPAVGTLDFNSDGSFKYIPPPDFCGSVEFSYDLFDGTVGSNNAASVTINVGCVNDPPDAADDSATVAEDSGANAIDVLANDTFAPDVSEALTVSQVTQGANGSVAITGGGTGVSYTPNANFFGSDSFTYTVSDGNGGFDTATLAVTVTNLNDPPDATDDGATAAEDSSANPINVLANDTFAPDAGETLTVTHVTQGANGSVAITDGGTGVSYTPNADFFGNDSFTYTVSDGNGGFDTATAAVTVTNVNDPPIANNGSLTALEDTPATGTVTSTDIDGPGATYAVVTGPAEGVLVLDPNTGNYSYTPALNDNDSHSFTFSVDDGAGGTATATVTINITPVNDPPVCEAAAPSIASLWPPDHSLVNISVLGVTDPVEGSGISINVDSIFQDEPTNTIGDGNTPIDGYGIDTPVAQVRRERSGSKRVPGDGRMYYINFTGTDAQGGTCTGTVRVGVPHDMGQDHVIGAGPAIYSSTGQQ